MDDDCRPSWWRSWSDRLFAQFPSAVRPFYVAMNCCVVDRISICEIAERLGCDSSDVIDDFGVLLEAGLLAAAIDGDVALVCPLHDGPRSLM